jgi:hypothetical protein
MVLCLHETETTAIQAVSTERDRVLMYKTRNVVTAVQ